MSKSDKIKKLLTWGCSVLFKHFSVSYGQLGRTKHYFCKFRSNIEFNLGKEKLVSQAWHLPHALNQILPSLGVWYTNKHTFYVSYGQFCAQYRFCWPCSKYKLSFQERQLVAVHTSIWPPDTNKYVFGPLIEKIVILQNLVMFRTAKPNGRTKHFSSCCSDFLLSREQIHLFIDSTDGKVSWTGCKIHDELC